MWWILVNWLLLLRIFLGSRWDLVLLSFSVCFRVVFLYYICLSVCCGFIFDECLDCYLIRFGCRLCSVWWWVILVILIIVSSSVFVS